MPITTHNILSHEWTGLTVSIEHSTDPNLRGVSGFVRDETRNTLTIEIRGRIVKIAKAQTVFATTLPTGETLTVTGNQMRHRPEDRVKKGLKTW